MKMNNSFFTDSFFIKSIQLHLFYLISFHLLTFQSLTMNFKSCNSRSSSSNVFILFFIEFICVFAFNPFEEVTKIDYMSSAYAVRNLAQLEQKILNVLVQYQKSLENKLDIVNKYLDEVLFTMENSKNSFIKIRNISVFDLDTFTNDVSNHPFKSLHIMQRYTNVIPLIEKNAQNNTPEKVFQSSIHELRKELSFPTESDVLQSLLSLLRLKYTYSLSVSELMEGNFHGYLTNSGLRMEDILQLGIVALRSQMYPLSFECFEETLRLAHKAIPVNNKLIAQVKSLMVKALKRHDEGLISGKFKSEQNPFHFENILACLESDSFSNKIPITLKPDISNLSDSIGIQTAFSRLCSGEELRKPSVTKQYKCKLRNVPAYFLLQPMKIEEINQDPFIVLIHDALSTNEINKIIKTAEPNLKRSKVYSQNESMMIDFARTSSNTWFPDYEPNNEFQFISKRVEMMTGLRVNYFKASEDLQVANYGPGGLYGPHLDVSVDPTEEFNMPDDGVTDLYHERGDRIATFMFYLSEVEKGGGTAFPGLGIAIQPIKGSAVFWFNLKNDVSAHLRTLHGGCPVLHGSKWIANKWIRSNEQMFIKKCIQGKS